jgi:hypothetical protein
MIRPRPPYVRGQRTEVEAGGPRSRSGRSEGKNICPCKKSNPQPGRLARNLVTIPAPTTGVTASISTRRMGGLVRCELLDAAQYFCVEECTFVLLSKHHAMKTCGGMQINLHSFLTWVALLLCIREVKGSNFRLEIGIQFRVSRDLFSPPVHDRILPINWKYRDSTLHILGYWQCHYISSSPNVIKRLNKIVWDGKSLCQMWERKETCTKIWSWKIEGKKSILKT